VPDSVAANGALTSALRGSVLHFLGDPADFDDPQAAVEFFTDGMLVVREGLVAGVGPAADVQRRLPPDASVTEYAGKLIVPGFIDTHTHYAQTDMMASDAGDVLEWLQRHTFATEQRCADVAYSVGVAEFFIQELLRNGTTTALVFATVHRQSVDAIFGAAHRRRMRLVAGKVMMDRNCPQALRDTPESSYDDSKALIAQWHGRGRLLYAVTPRFAPTSSDRQLMIAGKLADEHPDAYVQSHLAESQAEVAWVRTLFPDSRSYLDVYDRYGLVRERAVYAHCLHLDGQDRARMAQAGAAMAFCATSNLFLGSGLFDLDAAASHGVRVGIGTDVGAGTSLGMLACLNESYKVAQLLGQRLSPLRAFYLATLGGARSLYLDTKIGSFTAGKEADFVVLDPASTPLLERRMRTAAGLADKLLVLMMLGDDRTIAATAYACDLTVLVIAMFLFSSDPGWVTYLIAMVVIITGAFRFGTIGAWSAAAVSSVGYLAIAAFRTGAFGFVTPPERAIFIVAVFGLTALLLDRGLRELRQLRDEREGLITGLQRRVAEDAALEQVMRIVAGVPSADAIVPAVLRASRDVLRFDRATVFVADEELGEYRPLYRLAASAVAEAHPPPRLQLGEGVPGAALAGDSTLLVRHLLADPRYVSVRPNEEPRSVVLVPLRVRGRTVAVFSLSRSLPDAFGADDVRLAETVAGLVAQVLENDRLFAEASQAEALRAAEKLKDEFLATISHELRTPLTVIGGSIELLAQGRASDSEQLIAQARRHVERLDRTVQDLLALAIDNQFELTSARAARACAHQNPFRPRGIL